MATGGWCLYGKPDRITVSLPHGQSYALPVVNGGVHVPADPVVVAVLERLLRINVDGEVPLSLNDFGAGVGQYGRALLSADPRFSSRYTAYDGAGNVEEWTRGFVHWFDLTLPLSLPRTDWVLSLEVGEHIPRAYEGEVLRNLHAHNCRGIIISWARLNQTGMGHVNNHESRYLIDRFRSLGYQIDFELSDALRSRRHTFSNGSVVKRHEGNWWFDHSVLAFRRRVPLRSSTCNPSQEDHAKLGGFHAGDRLRGSRRGASRLTGSDSIGFTAATRRAAQHIYRTHSWRKRQREHHSSPTPALRRAGAGRETKWAWDVGLGRAGCASHSEGTPPTVVFIYDWRTLQAAVEETFGGKADVRWYDTYVQWAQLENLGSMRKVLPQLWSTESPDFFIQANLRKVLASDAWRGGVRITKDPNEADVVIWAVWDYAMCIAAGHWPFDYQLTRGFFQHSCPEHWRLLQWLRGTARWQRHGGADHVILATGLHYLSPPPLGSDPPYASIPVGDGLPVVRASESSRRRQGLTHTTIAALREITAAATFIILEDRAHALPPERTIIAPYHAKVSSPHPRKRRPYLAMFAGSVDKPNLCTTCAGTISPARLRWSIVTDLIHNCNQSCHVSYVRGKDDTRLTDQLANEGDRPAHILYMRQAVFCPIPRGDSATSKRLYDAIMQGCIPVIVSDQLRLPFRRYLSYTGAVLTLPEQFLLDEAGSMRLAGPLNFSLTHYLQKISSSRVRQMQRKLGCLRRALSFDDSMPPEDGLAPSLAHTDSKCSRVVQNDTAAPRVLDLIIASSLARRRCPSQALPA